MKFLGITPIHRFDNFWIKREDIAYWSSLEYPSGSKVRQYLQMSDECFKKAANNVIGDEIFNPPCLVGCSANSAMAIYVSSTAKQLNTKGIIYTAKRKIRSAAIEYAIKMGAEVNEMTAKQGHYKNNLEKHAKQRAIDLKAVIRWDRTKAIEDTIEQCQNIPEGIKRIIVPTGSGLTAAGVLVGVAKYCLFPGPDVIAVCTSPMADMHKIHRLAFSAVRGQDLKAPIQSVITIPPSMPYDVPKVESLPDGTPLDPFYAAKAWQYMAENDLFWPPGLRPVIAMPEICRRKFEAWKGPE